MTTTQTSLQEKIRAAARASVADYLSQHGIAKQWDLVQVIKSVQCDFGINTEQYSAKPYRYIREFESEGLFKKLILVDLVSGESYSLFTRNSLGMKF